MVLYFIFKHYSILPYLSFLKKKKKNTHGYLYITFKHHNTKKEKHYCMHKARMMNLIYIYIYIKEELKELYIILPSSHKEDFSTMT